MVLLRGKTMVTCPKDKREVNIKRVCAECEFSGPVSLEGMYTLIIACKFVPAKPEETIEELERPETDGNVEEDVELEE